MNIEIVIIGAAIHILFWEKLPEWGTLFSRIVAALPQPLKQLYKDWHCAYCAGFWIALVLHGLTGMFLFPTLENVTFHLGVAGQPIAWILDALGAAAMIYFASLGVKAIGLPAMKAHQMKADFLKSLKESEH